MCFVITILTNFMRLSRWIPAAIMEISCISKQNTASLIVFEQTVIKNYIRSLCELYSPAGASGTNYHPRYSACYIGVPGGYCTMLVPWVAHPTHAEIIHQQKTYCFCYINLNYLEYPKRLNLN